MKTAQGAFVLRPGEGTTYRVGGSPIVYKVRGAETGGRFEITESTLPPGFGGVPPHVHRDTDHAFYVLEGELEVQVGDDRFRGGPGTCIFAPRGAAHTFGNPGTDLTRYLQIDSGPGRERFFEEIARAFPGDTPIDRRLMGEILARYDTRPAEPPRLGNG
ncbi:MAG TPA: cupin domain-containing protein [Thermomicrobiales bacterium]|nr:cupin domain-containing protein [Thermomicrobiales bacterium]